MAATPSTALYRWHVVLLGMAMQVDAPCQISLDPGYTPQLRPQVTHVREVMPIHDGRTVIVEHWPGGPGESQFYNELACLHADGSRDEGYAQLSNVLELLPWNDGAYYLWRANYPNYVLRRHVANGAGDPDFQIATEAWPGRFLIDHLRQVKVDDQGRIYLVGEIDLLNEEQEVIAVRQLIRLTVQGDLDTTFTPGLAPSLSAAFPLPDGRVLLSGTQTSYNGVPVPRMFMVHADGSIDTDFSTGFLKAITACVLPLPDGGLIATGSFINYISLIELDTSYVVKLLPDGSQDADFDHDLRPFQEYNTGSYTQVYSIVEWGQDHYLISGNFDEVNGLPRRGMAMIDRAGALVLDQCDWPGPGPVDGRVFLKLVKDVDGAVFAHGTFSGFDDGETSRSTMGLARFTQGSVGMQERAVEAQDLRLFPVPARDVLTVQYQGRAGGAFRSVAVIDASGRVVKVLAASGATVQYQIELQGLSPGTYHVRAVMEGGTVLHRSFLLVP
jgi:hypothetical protein